MAGKKFAWVGGTQLPWSGQAAIFYVIPRVPHAGPARRFFARSHPAARSLHPGSPYLRLEAIRLPEAGVAGHSRSHRGPAAGDRVALPSQGCQEAVLPFDGIPDGALAGRQSVEPAGGGTLSRGAG